MLIGYETRGREFRRPRMRLSATGAAPPALPLGVVTAARKLALSLLATIGEEA